MDSRLSLEFLRRSIFISAGLCLLITALSIWRFPAILYPLRVGIVYATVLAIVLVVYILLTSRLTRNTDSSALWLAHQGFRWGLLIAGFWLAEIVSGNLLDPKYSLVKLVYFGSSAFAFSLPIFAGIAAARQTGSIATGTQVGLWSGLVSGLLTFLILMTITYFFLNTLLQDPENILQFKASGAPDLTTFIVGDSLAGATGHLIIGLILGPAFGAIGGVIGKALTQQTSKSAI